MRLFLLTFRSLCPILSLTCALSAHAEGPAGSAASSIVFQSRRPLQVTGQLAPFRFLVNDVLLFERPRSYTEMMVNNIKVRLTKTEEDRNARFFKFETDAEALSIVAKTWNDLKDEFKLRTPKVTSVKWDGEQFTFLLTQNSDYATIDKDRVRVDDDKISWDPGAKSLDPHTLVLRGEGLVPDTTIDFQLVSKTEYRDRLAKKKREDKKNKNRLLAGKKETWIDRVEWKQAEFDLGLRFGGGSSFTLGAALAPHYAYSPTFGLRGLLGVAVFTGPLGLEVGPRLGLHATYALPFAPARVELGPSVYLLTQGVGLAAAIDLLALYELGGQIPLVDTVGLNYSLWLKPSASALRLVTQIKF